MAERAANLVEEVFPTVPVRQWVLTVPPRLRYRLAFDHTLCRAVLGVFVRAVLGDYRRRARRQGVRDGHGGSVTVIQRFGGGLQLNVHYHSLLVDGVFTEAPDGSVRFHPAPPPTDVEVGRLLATIRTRILRLLRRRGVLGEPEEGDAPDPLAETSLVLAGITSAAVQGRSALGPRPGARVLQIGRVPGIPYVTSTGPRQAHLDGFDLHANVAVAADNREALEQLCRYVLRPPIAQERLTRTADGRILLTLKAEWSDGTTALLFEPVELLERLAALTPRPRINLVLHHGVFAPHSRWRARVVAYGREPVAPPGADEPATAAPVSPPPPPPPPPPSATSSCNPPRDAPVQEFTPEVVDPTPSHRPRAWSWPDLLRHTFAVDVFACPRCGGRMRVIATIEDPVAIRKILTHLGLPTEPPTPRPPPADLLLDA
jgi:hypothetical protein